MQPYLRLYTDFIDDCKIQKLSDKVRLKLVELWCLCAKYGGEVPSDDEIALRLHLPLQKAKNLIKHLIEQGFIDEIQVATVDGDVTLRNGDATVTQPLRNGDVTRLQIHNWKKRQSVSDNSRDRMRKYRENKKKMANAMLHQTDITSDITSNITAPSQAESHDARIYNNIYNNNNNYTKGEYEGEKHDQPVADAPSRPFFSESGAEETQTPSISSSPTPGRKAAKRSSERGTVCPLDFKPSAKHYAQGAELGFSPADVDKICQTMIDWSHANANRQIARKSDWDRTLKKFINERHDQLNPPKRKINGRDAIL
jgi:hypothetical protein